MSPPISNRFFMFLNSGKCIIELPCCIMNLIEKSFYRGEISTQRQATIKRNRWLHFEWSSPFSVPSFFFSFSTCQWHNSRMLFLRVLMAVLLTTTELFFSNWCSYFSFIHTGKQSKRITRQHNNKSCNFITTPWWSPHSPSMPSKKRQCFAAANTRNILELLK